LVPVFSALICAWGLGSTTGGFSFTAPTPGEIVGAVVGLFIGLAVCLDDGRVRRQMEEGEGSAADTSRPPSEAIAVVMLIIPLVAGALIWQREWLQLTTPAALMLGCATVVSTAVLGYLDSRQLILRRPTGQLFGGAALSPPVGAFLSILALWVLAYPVHFLARRRLGARNLFAPALVAAVAFLAPSVRAWFGEPALPSASDPDVIALVERSITDSPWYQAGKDEIGAITIHNPVEVSFDPEKQRRVCRAVLVSNLGEYPIFYTVEWQDRNKRIIAVQVYEKQP
jgi:hypothetical protein